MVSQFSLTYLFTLFNCFVTFNKTKINEIKQICSIDCWTKYQFHIIRYHSYKSKKCLKFQSIFLCMKKISDTFLTLSKKKRIPFIGIYSIVILWTFYVPLKQNKCFFCLFIFKRLFNCSIDCFCHLVSYIVYV